MIDVIKGLVKAGRLCVMATIADGDRPYSSLMRYVSDDACTQIYLVTHRSTSKYQNLWANPNVSLLIDTREKGPLAEVQALSIDGRFVPIEGSSEQKNICRRLIARHPDLKTFAEHPDAVPICIQIHSFLLLSGLQDAHHVRLKK